MLLFRWIEKQRYMPAGKKTVPPPVAAAASIARLIAGESTALPSPLAPKLFTSKKPELFRSVGPDALTAFRLFVWLWVRVDPHKETSKIRKTRLVKSALFVFIIISTRGMVLAKQSLVTETSVSDSVHRVHRLKSGPLTRSLP